MRGGRRRELARQLLDPSRRARLLPEALEQPNLLGRLLALAFSRERAQVDQALDAIEDVAKALVASGKGERVRELARRVVWLMNDESGGVCWCGPEVLARLMVADPSLVDPFLSVMVGMAGRAGLEESMERALRYLSRFQIGCA